MKVLLIASARELRDIFIEAAKDLGREIALQKHELIYGGGDRGLMGHTSREALKYGAKVTGIIPEMFYAINKEQDHASLSTTIIKNLFERKEQMIEISDIAVCLPGGIGSLDEILEMGAANDIMAYSEPTALVKPIIILNIDGFYDGLKMQFERCVQESAIFENRMKMLHFVETVPEAITVIERAEKFPQMVQTLQ